jgi:hypothetical protein
VVASRGGRKPFRGGSAGTQISPLRYAPVEMTKGMAVLPGTVVAEQNPFRVEGRTAFPLRAVAEEMFFFLDFRSGPQQPSPLSSRPERSAVERSAVQRTLRGNVK